VVLLRVNVVDQMKWFDELVAVNENYFDSVCRSILMSIFLFMQDAMIADGDRLFQKLIRDYF